MKIAVKQPLVAFLSWVMRWSARATKWSAVVLVPNLALLAAVWVWSGFRDSQEEASGPVMWIVLTAVYGPGVLFGALAVSGALALSSWMARGLLMRSAVGSFLEFCARFCRGDARENLRATAADLRKDVRDMLKNRCSRAHIQAVRFWITTTTVAPIVWDGCVRVSKKLPVLGGWIRAVSAWLGKIDPPRLG